MNSPTPATTFRSRAGPAPSTSGSTTSSRASLENPRRVRAPPIDDISVYGYKYGPPRSFAASHDGSTGSLTWARPYRSTAATSTEERTIAYGVWRRSVKPLGGYTELTSGGLLADGALSYGDSTSLTPGTIHEYVLQTTDAGQTGYSELVSDQVLIPGDTTAPVLSDDVVANYAGPATISLSATDAAGVDSISYRVDTGTTTTVSADSTQVNVSADGAHSITYTAEDYAGNAAAPVTRNFFIDGNPPTVNDDAVATYTVNPAQFTITADDGAGSGIDYIEYKIDSAATQTVSAATAPVSVTGEGAHTVTYVAYDAAGQMSLVRTANLTIDSLAPTASDNAAALYDASPANFTITASDGAGTGVDYIEYKIDGNATQTVSAATAPVSVTGEGAHQVRYVAYDNAGNVSSLGTADLRIDTTAPTVSDDATTYYTATPANFTITAGDGAGSGIDDIEYKIDSAATQTVSAATAPVSVTGEGAHRSATWPTTTRATSHRSARPTSRSTAWRPQPRTTRRHSTMRVRPTSRSRRVTARVAASTTSSTRSTATRPRPSLRPRPRSR